MPVQTIQLSGRRYVLLPDAEYKRLVKTRGRARPAPAKPSRRRSAKATRLELSEDEADLIVSLRRLKDPREKRVSLRDAKRALGLA